ncbi:MAG: hypothetical protein ABI304_08110 [Rudaea sp.]
MNVAESRSPSCAISVVLSTKSHNTTVRSSGVGDGCSTVGGCSL